MTSNHFSYKTNLRRLASLGLLLATCCVMTGCMTSPHDGLHIGTTGSEFRADGFILEPGSPVTVQYFHHATKTWKVMDVARSGWLKIEWSGQTWYYWQANNLRIPPGGWFPLLDGQRLARVRTVWDGDSLAAFHQPFENIWAPNKTMEQMWLEDVKKNGNEAVIFANP